MSSSPLIPAPSDVIHRYRNNQSAIEYGDPAWSAALRHGLIDIRVDYDRAPYLRRSDGHLFINLCSCSYLGLANHPAVLDGAIEALRSQQAIDLPISRIRLRLNLLEEFEALLTEQMGVRTISAVTCSAATAGTLPLIASGHLCPGQKPPVMAFDKFAHFSMQYMMPVCADETEVLTLRHNDINALEDLCRKRPRVAYVCDGVYSVGGATPIRDLLYLQDRYGLFLFIDDSHSLSVCGPKGEGYVRSSISEVNDLTVIVASLGKGFGTSGGIVMLGPGHLEHVLTRFGGPLAWSQGLNIPAIGASMASIRLHRSSELARLQGALQANATLFDQLIDTEQKGDGFPIKVIFVGDEQKAVDASTKVLEEGFYTSAIFFPIVRKGNAALRVMLRADLTAEHIRSFAHAVRRALHGDEGAGTALSAAVAPVPKAMRAVVITAPGGPEVLAVRSIPTPDLLPGEVLVRVQAAALNYGDILQREGEFPPPAGESEIPGVEIAGDVAAAGENAGIAIGTPVFGLVGGGGYAEFCKIDAEMAIPIPPGFSYADTAALCEAFFTADTALCSLGGIRSGDAVLIHGAAGGIGTAAVQIARALGARIACTVGSREKVSRVISLGADLAIHHREADFRDEIRDWTSGEGVGVVLDIVGSDYFDRNLDVLKEGGVLVQIGIMSGTRCELDLDKIILRRLQIKGSVMRILPIAEKRALAWRFRQRWLPRLIAREVRAVVDSIHLFTEAARAQERLAGREHFGKIILDFGAARREPHAERSVVEMGAKA